jgi:SAM-dependent methyltransferase
VTAATPNGRWAAKASSLYDETYARAYRAHDEALDGTRAYEQFVQWLRGVCRRFDGEIDVLDLGCGTGRYFWALEQARSLVGIDASDAMLAEARTPFRAGDVSVERVELVCDDLMTAEFPRDRFDLVYAIGVLAEHAPLTADLVARIAAWTRTAGRFAFTTVHPDSPSIPRTAHRRLASTLAPWLPGAAEGG